MKRAWLFVTDIFWTFIDMFRIAKDIFMLAWYDFVSGDPWGEKKNMGK